MNRYTSGILRVFFIFSWFMTLVLLCAFGDSKTGICLNVEKSTVYKGKTTRHSSDLYFPNQDHKLVEVYGLGDHGILLLDSTAKAELFNPVTNEYWQCDGLESFPVTSLLYYFMQNRFNDLGLLSMGFEPGETRFSEQTVSTEYFPADSLHPFCSRIVLDRIQYRPVALNCYNSEGKLMQHLRFENFASFPGFSIPQTIMETVYTPGDSICTTFHLSRIKSEAVTENAFFNYSIPKNTLK